MTLLLVASLAACGSDDAAKAELEALKAENEQLQSQLEQAAVETEAPFEAPEEEEEEAPAIQAVSLKIGDQIDNDLFTMTFDSMQILDGYEYQTGEHSSMSLYVEEGYKVLLIKGHFENKGTSAISDTAFYKGAVINSNYVADEYDVRLQFQRDKYFEIDPYTDRDYILYINIPEKLAQQFETATFSLAFKNDMSMLTTTWNSDGTKTVDAEQYYEITGN